MKTYEKTTTTTEPLLKIRYDSDAESPREWSNLGYFITVDSNYHSPDENEEFKRIIEETGNEADSQEHHMKLIKEEIEGTCEKVLAIYPITKYEHSSVSYSLGTKHGFDNSNNGFYIITKESRKETGIAKKDFEKAIEQELEDYNKWVNGETYCFTLYNKEGKIEDACGGFYSLDHIKESLPKEWQDEDMSEYLEN